MSVDAPELRTSRPYRVLFISSWPQVSGAERSLLDLLAHLSQEVITPLVLLPHGGPIEQELHRLEVPYRKVPYEWWLARRNWLPIFAYRLIRTAFFFPRLVNEVRRLRPDLVYTNSLVIPEGAVLAALLRKPHIWHVREAVEGNETLGGPLPPSLIFRIVPRVSARVIAISESVRSQFPLQARKSVKVIYNGVELSTQDSREGRTARMSEGHAQLAVVGTLSEAKGQLDAIKAIELLRDEFTGISLSIVGDGTPAYRKVLERYVYAHGLATHVSFLGHVKDPTPVLRASDLLLMPSKKEAFGRITIESLAVGTPVVGTDAGGTPEILGRGGGVLVPPGRPDLMAAAVRDLLRSPNRLETLRSEALKTAEFFSIQRTAALVQDEIVDVIEGGK